jgi:hypothetical protein
MAVERMHWRPETPFSYPIPSKGQNYRCFLLSGALGACQKMPPGNGNWTVILADVTCKRCLKIASIGRYDTPETIAEVTSRGGCTPVDTSEDPR